MTQLLGLVYKRFERTLSKVSSQDTWKEMEEQLRPQVKFFA